MYVLPLLDKVYRDFASFASKDKQERKKKHCGFMLFFFVKVVLDYC